MVESSRPASPATVGEAELLRSVSSTTAITTRSSNSPNDENNADDVMMKKKGKRRKKADKQANKSSSLPSEDTSNVDESMINNNNGPPANDNDDDDDANDDKPAITQQYVDHSYTDYAIVEEDDLRLLDENSSLLPNPSSQVEATAREKLKGMSCTYGPMKKNAGGVVHPFPGKLLEVLDRSDLVEIIDWMPHGRAFIVKKPKLFTTNVLPRFFKQTKFLSFTRQLNLWGFKRITRGIDAGAYYHELFLRGRPYLAMRMRRQKIKGTGMKLTPNPEGEPNFYNNWPALPPLNERRVLPPLPPLPAERLGLQVGGPIDRASENMLNALQQQVGGIMGSMDKNKVGGGAGGGGASTMDRVSENMLNALKYGAAAGGGGPADNVSSFLRQQKDHHMQPNHFSQAFGNAAQQMQQHQQFGGGLVVPEQQRGHPVNQPTLPPISSVRNPGGGGGPPQPRYAPGTNPVGGYDDLLLAPGVSPFENASRLRYLEQQHQSRSNGDTTRNGGPGGGGGGPGGGGLNPNDPIHDELSAMIRSRSQQAAAASAAAIGTGMYPPQQLSSDRLLMERLRDLDRAQQIKREQQDMSMLHHARLFDDLASQSAAAVGAAGGVAPPGVVGAVGVGVHTNGVPHGANGQNVGNAGLPQGVGPFDARLSYPGPPQLHPPSMSSQSSVGRTSSTGPKGGGGPRQDPFARYGNDPVESSVKDALREANHLEELALAQRAKARSLALAGALQSRFGVVEGVSLSSNNTLDGQQQQQQQQLSGSMKIGPSSDVVGGPSPSNESAALGDSRPSFGRPFGRKD